MGSDVRIAHVEAFVLDLPAIALFMLAGGAHSRPGEPSPRVYVKVTGDNGVVGWGESTPCPTWSYETTETIYWTITRYLAPVALGRPAWDLDGLNRAMNRAIMPGISAGQPIAKAGLDIAVHDLLCRSLGMPLYGLLGGKRREAIELGYVVSTESPDEAAETMRRGLELGYRACKVKVGIHGEAGDFEQVARVREVLGPDAFLWVDANQGYFLDQALRQSRRLESLEVAAFEQPIPANDIYGAKRLMESTSIPVALDESLRGPAELAQYIRLGAVEVAIAKVQRSGGLWYARQFCTLAENAHVRLMGSGLSETDLGLATSLHLYAAFGIDTPVDLNGRQFVEAPHIARGVEIEGGMATVPDGPGIGIEIDEEIMRRYVRPMPTT